MKREVEKVLDKWYKKEKSKPLIIRGARQVGKSTLVRMFASSQKINLFEVNLERHIALKGLFENFNMKEILNEIEIICNKRGILKKNTIIFLDEIQAIPEAIAALRYFYEEYPNLKVVAAGSLLEFVLLEHSFSMPVGRIEYLFMNPMSFNEFLEAKNEIILLDYIKNYNFENIFSDTIHEKLLSLGRDYFLVGGMPEAVQAYIDNQQFDDISAIHTSIIQTYLDDFAKYAGINTLQTLQKVFNYVGISPGVKTKYSNIDSDIQSRELKKAINLLEKAKVIFRVTCSTANGIPLSFSQKEKIYKLFFLDIGLMNRMSKISNMSINKVKEIDFINKGVIAEQFIAQNLMTMLPHNETPELFYWLREGKLNNAELDFIIQHQDFILPIEIKAGKKGTLKSLHRFMFEKKGNLALRFDTNKPSLQQTKTTIANSQENVEVSYDLISLPFYMVNFSVSSYQLAIKNKEN